MGCGVWVPAFAGTTNWESSLFPFRPQLEALDLSGRRLRQVFAEFDPARIFVGRELLLHMLLQRANERIVRLLRRLEHDEGFRLDQLLLVVPADDRGFQNV